MENGVAVRSEERTLDDGTGIVSCTWPAGAEDPVALWWVEVYYPDGSSLDITETNGADYELDPTRSDAPLSLEALTDIATADEWRALIG